MGEVAMEEECPFCQRPNAMYTPNRDQISIPISAISSNKRIIQSASTATIQQVRQNSGHTDIGFNPHDAWLPITESRKGTKYTSTFHLICSGIGNQALVLPLAFTSLGWTWGTLCLSIEFLWQLYTIWLLVQLHESVPGTRYSRYLHLAIASFGPKLGKILAIFPVMYLSGGTCVMLIINGAAAMEKFYQIASGDDANKPLTGAEWFLIFTCLAIVIAQFFPNLNSLAGVSLIGAITAIGYCTFLWVLSVSKDRPDGVSYNPSDTAGSRAERVCEILNAIGILALAFRGHNLVLEIQGTLPSSSSQPSREPMWRGVTVSYLVIAVCLYPLAIVGYWAYGNKMPSTGGILSAFYQFHGKTTSKFIMGMVYFLVMVNCLSSFQIYGMPFFDNLELRYTAIKNKRCPRQLRAAIKVLFGGLTYLVAVAFPFLGSLAGLIGGFTLPLTLAYPCFMWLKLKRPRPFGASWCLNFGLGCLGILLSMVLVGAAIWLIVEKGMETNFFKPR